MTHSEHVLEVNRLRIVYPALGMRVDKTSPHERTTHPASDNSDPVISGCWLQVNSHVSS